MEVFSSNTVKFSALLQPIRLIIILSSISALFGLLSCYSVKMDWFGTPSGISQYSVVIQLNYSALLQPIRPIIILNSNSALCGLLSCSSVKMDWFGTPSGISQYSVVIQLNYSALLQPIRPIIILSSNSALCGLLSCNSVKMTCLATPSGIWEYSVVIQLKYSALIQLIRPVIVGVALSSRRIAGCSATPWQPPHPALLATNGRHPMAVRVSAFYFACFHTWNEDGSNTSPQPEETRRAVHIKHVVYRPTGKNLFFSYLWPLIGKPGISSRFMNWTFTRWW